MNKVIEYYIDQQVLKFYWQHLHLIHRSFSPTIGKKAKFSAIEIQPRYGWLVRLREFLNGFVYTEICRQTRHSAKAVKRYVNTFGRVVALYERGVQEAEEIAHYTGISARLAAEYLELYFQVRSKSGCRRRIEELLERLSSRRSYPGVDKSGMGKGGSG